jgi:hypothetical protein
MADITRQLPENTSPWTSVYLVLLDDDGEPEKVTRQNYFWQEFLLGTRTVSECFDMINFLKNTA